MAFQAPAWGLLGLSVQEMRQRLRADLVAAQAEIFLVNGDINSNLYTSTRAMHSAIIGLLQVTSLAVSPHSCVRACFGSPQAIMIPV